MKLENQLNLTKTQIQNLIKSILNMNTNKVTQGDIVIFLSVSPTGNKKVKTCVVNKHINKRNGETHHKVRVLNQSVNNVIEDNEFVPIRAFVTKRAFDELVASDISFNVLIEEQVATEDESSRREEILEEAEAVAEVESVVEEVNGQFNNQYLD